MKRTPTLFLKLVILLIGLAVLAFCVFVMPIGIRTDSTGLYSPLLIAMYFPAIPFFFALYQTLNLLSYIDQNRAFSNLSVKALKNIKYSAIAISVFYVLALPFIYNAADQDDAPGVMVLGLVFAFGPIVVATFAAVLQKLLEDAINIKSENDLTV